VTIRLALCGFLQVVCRYIFQSGTITEIFWCICHCPVTARPAYSCVTTIKHIVHALLYLMSRLYGSKITTYLEFQKWAKFWQFWGSGGHGFEMFTAKGTSVHEFTSSKPFCMKIAWGKIVEMSYIFIICKLPLSTVFIVSVNCVCLVCVFFFLWAVLPEMKLIDWFWIFFQKPPLTKCHQIWFGEIYWT